MRHENELTLLAARHNTDKWGSHWYAQHYHRHFEPRQRECLRVLEIGIGGYDDPNAGGASLRMWRDYFKFSTIVGFDLHDKSPQAGDRIKIVRGDQSDVGTLLALNNDYGPFDIIIDDGSHINAHVLKSFEVLFPLLHRRGLYAIEDTQTSYWKNWGGDSVNLNRPDTSMGYCKSLVDAINNQEITDPAYSAGYPAKNIIGMHFYHSLVIIEKGDNDETSTVVTGNQPNESTG